MPNNSLIASILLPSSKQFSHLLRYIPPFLNKKTFRDMLEYMGNVNCDEYNPMLETPDEKEIASEILRLINAKDNRILKLNYIHSEKLYEINLEDKIEHNINNIAYPKVISTDEGDIKLRFADFILAQESKSGEIFASQDHFLGFYTLIQKKGLEVEGLERELELIEKDLARFEPSSKKDIETLREKIRKDLFLYKEELTGMKRRLEKILRGGNG